MYTSGFSRTFQLLCMRTDITCTVDTNIFTETSFLISLVLSFTFASLCQRYDSFSVTSKLCQKVLRGLTVWIAEQRRVPKGMCMQRVQDQLNAQRFVLDLAEASYGPGYGSVIYASWLEEVASNDEGDRFSISLPDVLLC